MIHATARKLAGLCALLFILAILLPAQAPERFFDTAPAEHQGVRLVVFYPSVGTIMTLEELRKAGLLDVPDLLVIGVHHAKERDDYAYAREYINEKKIDWFRFHTVTADLPESDIFKKNACTADFEKIFAGADGIIFFGGPDIPPSTYGAKTSLLSEITDPVRHHFELSAIFHLLGGSQDPSFPALLEKRPDFPIIGFCLGCQSLNVGTGGTLYQDIWSEIYGQTTFEGVIALGSPFWHRNPYSNLYPNEKLMGSNYHQIRIDPSGKFCAAMGFKPSDQPRVLSSHHQALAKMGKGLRVIASSMDGKVVEAVEHERFRNVLGVQFHPEATGIWDPERKSRQAPTDTPFNIRALLESTPPSLEFHKGIWNWWSRVLSEKKP